MSNDIVQADYERLAEVAKRFQNQAEINQQMRADIQRAYDAVAAVGLSGFGGGAVLSSKEKGGYTA